jgi:hypothetical protein
VSKSTITEIQLDDLQSGIRLADYRGMARLLSRARFADLFPCLFLASNDVQRRVRLPQRTDDLTTSSGDVRASEPPPATLSPSDDSCIIAVRKHRTAYPAMITVGRTRNNDVVVDDVRISKFHASFRRSGVMLALADAGSRNGTWVRSHRLTPRERCIVRAGDELRFAETRFTLLDAARCWDVIHGLDPEGGAH